MHRSVQDGESLLHVTPVRGGQKTKGPRLLGSMCVLNRTREERTSSRLGVSGCHGRSMNCETGLLSWVASGTARSWWR